MQSTFNIYTYYAALRWLLQINDPLGRIMCWRIRLSEFDFEPRYKTGSRNSAADMASRLVTNAKVAETYIEIPQPPIFSIEIAKKGEDATLRERER